MSRPKVCIYLPVDTSGDSHRRLKEAGCELVLGGATWSSGTDLGAVAELATGAAALMGSTIRGAPIGEAVLDRVPMLRLISKYTIGVEDIDIAAATKRGILVTHCPTEANWGGVAEGTMAMMLAMLKRVRERDREVERGGWRDARLTGQYLGARDDGYPGLTVGIVGLGRAGTRLASLLRPWRARVIAADPYVDAAHFAEQGVGAVDLLTLLGQADVVSLHCNLTDETRNLIGQRELRAMKPGAILINTSRGAVVSLDALCDALEAGAIAGAALDVLPEEPPPRDARILKLGDRVLLSPHMISANGPGTLHAAIPWATAATLAALKGEVPEHVYNIEAVPRWLERFGGKALIH